MGVDDGIRRSMGENAIILGATNRKISLALRLHLLLGGPWNQMGWVLALCSSAHIRLLIVPELSRMEHAITNPIQWLNFAFLLLALECLFLFRKGWSRGNLGLRLLRIGAMTTGQLKSSRPGYGILDGEPVYQLNFSFRVPDGRTFEARAYTTDPGRLKDESEEALLYDPSDPRDSILVDELPGKPRVDDHDAVMSREMFPAGVLLLLPGSVLATHAVWSLVSR